MSRTLIFGKALADASLVLLTSTCYLVVAALDSSSYLIAGCFTVVALSYIALGYLNLYRWILLAFLVIDSVVLAAMIGLAGDFIVSPAYVAVASTVIMAPPFVGLGLLVKYISSYDRQR